MALQKTFNKKKPFSQGNLSPNQIFYIKKNTLIHMNKCILFEIFYMYICKIQINNRKNICRQISFCFFFFVFSFINFLLPSFMFGLFIYFYLFTFLCIFFCSLLLLLLFLVDLWVKEGIKILQLLLSKFFFSVDISILVLFCLQLKKLWCQTGKRLITIKNMSFTCRLIQIYLVFYLDN